MNELQAVKSYLDTRIECLKREQGQHNWNEKIINELLAVRKFIDGLGCGCKKADAPNIGELLAMLEVLNKAEEKFKEKVKPTKVDPSKLGGTITDQNGNVFNIKGNK